MIGYLSGKPVVTTYSTLIITNGVGYNVLLTQTNKQQLATSDHCEVFIYPHIKEDAFDLYGFLSEAEKELFLKLINVDGVGPKTALNIMDKGADAVVSAVRTADVSFFSSIPRVGKKSAQKIIIELKNKLGSEYELDLAEPTGPVREVVEALVALGFPETKSVRIVQTFDLGAIRIEDAVKKAIQEMTKQ